MQYLYMIISSILLGSAVIISKEIALHVDLVIATTLRNILCASIVLPFYLLNSSKKKISFKYKIMLAIRSVFVMISQYSLFYYIKYTDASKAMVMLNSAPLFTPVLAVFFLKNKLNGMEIFSILVGFIGVIMLLDPGENIFSSHIFFGMMIGVSLGFSQLILFISSNKNRINTHTIVFYFYAFNAFFSAVVYVMYLKIDSVSMNILTEKYLGMLFVFLAIFSVANQVFRSLAYRDAPSPKKIMPLLFLSVVYVVVYDTLVKNISISAVSSVGILLVFIGIVLLNLSSFDFSQFIKRNFLMKK